MLTVKAMTGGEGYAGKHLSNNDYYSVGETITGQWTGRGAELLGLRGAVDLEAFDAIRQGIDPATGEFLRQRVSADRFSLENGERTGTARNLYDCTFSAPKAVSVMALEDPRVAVAHHIAVSEALIELESIAGTRVRRDGANGARETGNLVIARYDHDTSRELDPQLHSHCVAGNLTYDGVEGKWKALQAWEIYQQTAYLTEVYRNALAREVGKLGYAHEDRQLRGKDNGFGIVGIQEATLDKFSVRSAQKQQAITEFLNANGRVPSNNEIARLVRDTRPEKLKEITTEQVKSGQRARLTGPESEGLARLRTTAIAQGCIRQAAPAAPSLEYSAEHVFERLSTAHSYELHTEALRHGRGSIELPELKADLLARIASGAMLSARGEVATQATLARERFMIEAVSNGATGQHEALGRGRAFVVAEGLRPGQKDAVLAVLWTRDLAVNLRGAAGAGKTKTLQELQRGLNEARRSVVAVAPTTTAVEELQKVGFGGAVTVARLLSDPAQREGLKGQVLIIDEAGTVSSKDMAELIALAQKQGARIVFSGDTAQLKSVSEGDALRVLERESALKSVSLLQVERQISKEYKEAVETLRDRPAEGYDKLAAMGAIREVDWRLRGQEVARAYRAASIVPNAKGKERSVLVVAATQDDIKSITFALRSDRSSKGELGVSERFTHHTAMNWTEAQKKQAKNYQPGQVLEFHKAVKGIAKNEALEVVKAHSGQITARKLDGTNVQLSSRHVKAFAVFEQEKVDIAAGDKLLLQANRRESGFRATNGELVTVGAVDGGRIELRDGRVLPANYRQFTHGYAVTAHRSQGKTVDFEVIAAERMAHDLFYVAATRAREGLTVVTSDSLALQESIGVSGDRQSASELARRATGPKAAPPITGDELFTTYMAQQGPKPQPAVTKQKELTYVHPHARNVEPPRVGIGF